MTGTLGTEHAEQSARSCTKSPDTRNRESTQSEMGHAQKKGCQCTRSLSSPMTATVVSIKGFGHLVASSFGQLRAQQYTLKAAS